MPNYRRMVRPGGTFFFTIVTAGRSPLFADEVARSILGACLREERIARPFVVEAIVLLPDHLHTMWTLPEEDADFSTRCSSIKARFTRRWLSGGGRESAVRPGQARKRQRGVWQSRFHEHTIRDDDDFVRLVDYIHFNPVNHGLAPHPGEWPWSSFHQHVQKGFYPPEWSHPQDKTWAGLDTRLLE